MSDPLKARILAEMAKTPSPTREESRRKARGVTLAGAALTALVFFAMGGMKRGARASELVAFTAGAALVLAGTTTWLVVGARSMLGRPRAVLASGALAGSIALALIVAAASALWPSDEHVPSSIHAACGAMTILQGALPLAILLWPRRGADPVHPAVTGAALGVAAGAWSAMLAWLRCPHVEALHGLLAHAAPVLLLAASGALLGHRFLRLR